MSCQCAEKARAYSEAKVSPSRIYNASKILSQEVKNIKVKYEWRLDSKSLSLSPYPSPNCKLSYKLNVQAANLQVYRCKTSGKTLSDK